MKKRFLHIVVLAACCIFPFFTFSQGKVVINEYLPWPSNGCGATAEFVELLNFGPGPVDIGCYVLTDGDYSVTIPPNTILKPGQFFVIAGQNTIQAPCANISSDVVVNLNWNTCGCTNAPIPTTGHGFFTDGGGGSEQIVLLDPNLQVIDAVIRNLPVEPSALITTSAAGGCAPRTFDLDLMPINYETLGMSTGNGNSFARKLDGDCGWVKDPQQSAGATNNTPSDQSDVTYLFSYVNAMECKDNYGSVSIYVKKADYSGVFPMRYTLVRDTDLDGDYGFGDEYSNGVDSTAPDVFIQGLPSGRYRLTLESYYGCYLKNFEFQILPCSSPLASILSDFRIRETSDHQYLLEWKLLQSETVKALWVEKGISQDHFETDQMILLPDTSQGIRNFSVSISPDNRYYRLKILADNKILYSPVVRLQKGSYLLQAWPNPVMGDLQVRLHSETQGLTPYVVYNHSAVSVARGQVGLKKGQNQVQFSLATLVPGIYQLVIGEKEPISIRFVKH